MTMTLTKTKKLTLQTTAVYTESSYQSDGVLLKALGQDVDLCYRISDCRCVVVDVQNHSFNAGCALKAPTSTSGCIQYTL